MSEVDYYEEVLMLRKKVEKYETILNNAMSEKTGVFFICGAGGEKDSMGLQERINVCPSYGLVGVHSLPSNLSAMSYPELKLVTT